MAHDENLYREITIECWEELTYYSERRNWPDPNRPDSSSWIFRGQRNAEWCLRTKLERTLCRYGLELSVAAVWEWRLTREFIRKAQGFIPKPPNASEYMEWLALMQHHGGPTRLLDWTYSFWNAVLFAIEEARVGTGDSCAVWALEIPWWRDRVAQKVPKLEMYSSGSSSNEEMKYLLREKKPKPGIWPLNAYRLNERVIDQQGLFVAPLARHKEKLHRQLTRLLKAKT